MNGHGAHMGIAGAEAQRREPNFRASAGGPMMAIWAELRFSTAVLHRPNPVAREMPGFSGFFARRDQLAERESSRHRDFSGGHD